MTPEERISLLQSMPFFGAIEDSSVALILELSETQRVKAGEYFFHQGDLGDALYILEEGTAVIFKTAAGQEYILRRASAGGCFGDLALIDFTPHSASVRAESHCTAIRIPSSAMHTLFQQNAEQYLIIQMNMAREVSRRLRLANDRWFQLQLATGSAHPP
jgi:CRP/FNR family transcriptional regulator, cyclic AMP receptor protein